MWMKREKFARTDRDVESLIIKYRWSLLHEKICKLVEVSFNWTKLNLNLFYIKNLIFYYANIWTIAFWNDNIFTYKLNKTNMYMVNIYGRAFFRQTKGSGFKSRQMTYFFYLNISFKIFTFHINKFIKKIIYKHSTKITLVNKKFTRPLKM